MVVAAISARVAVTCLLIACAACGSGTGDRGPSQASRDRVLIATAAPGGATRSWGTPVVSGGQDGYVATLRSAASGSASASALKVRLSGIGYPGKGKTGTTAFVGPGVATPWTGIAHGQYTVSVEHTGRWLGLRIWSRGGRWRARVDGHYVDRTPQPVGSDYALHTIGLDLGHDQPSKRHLVQFELSGGAWLSGVVSGANDHVSLPPAPKGPSVYWLGDSYFAGGGARYPGFSDLVHAASARLGFRDVTVDALDGTGYLKANAAPRFPDYLTRARKDLGKGRAQPDRIIVGGSINDIGQTPPAVGAAARRLYAYIAKAVPAARVYVVVFAPRFPVPSNFAAMNRAVLAAAAAAPNVAGAFDLPSRVSRSAVGLQGSNDHPTQAGHNLYGQLIAGFIRSHPIRRTPR